MIINPLKVWVQNILPVVYDDSLSYLEVMAKINAKTNEIIEQTNANTQAIEQLSEVISELGDIDELKALLEEVETVIENLYTTDNPLMDGTANPGTANHAARSDHVHPSDTGKAPVNHASDSTDYGVGSNSNYGHVKLSDNINDTNTGVAATPSAAKKAYNKCITVTGNSNGAVSNSAIVSIDDSRITGNYKVVNIETDNVSLINSETLTWNTTAGNVTVNGTCLGAVNLYITLLED